MKTLEEALQEPFPADDVEWRIGSCGLKDNRQPWAKALCYVTNRAIQARLDKIFGVTGWKNEYMTGPQGGVVCGISVWDDVKKQWITKYDGSDNTAIDGTKGGLSKSMVRAAVQLGIGRYLYNLDETWVNISRNGKNYSQGTDKNTKQRFRFNWDTPSLPPWALPGGKGKP